MNNNLEISPNLQAGVESSTAVESVVDHFSEIINENTPKQSNQKKDDSVQKKSSSFGDISKKISQLLFHKESKSLPTTEVQRKKLTHHVEKQTKKLIKLANKIQRSGDFCAAKLEKIISKIRYLQKLLIEIVNATVENIEQMYRRLILK